MTKTAEEKIRCTEAEREAWTHAAREQNVSRAEFIRRAANAAANDAPDVESPARLAAAYAAVQQRATEEGRPCRHNRAPGKFCPVCDRG